jgi:transcriptional regulator with XRE-family HTH domain
MNTIEGLWPKLAKSKQYRERFVAAQAKQAIPFQIRELMKAKGLSQQELAERARLTQGAISRAANPKYGNLSLNTLIRIAAGFDVAFVGRFVPFSELVRWLDHLHDESTSVLSFKEEQETHADKPFNLSHESATCEASLKGQHHSTVELWRLTAPRQTREPAALIPFPDQSREKQVVSASTLAAVSR